MTPVSHRLVSVPDGRDKSRLLFELAVRDAAHPSVRELATRIAASTPHDVERLRRLHRLVQTGVPYYREPLEMFAPAAHTLRFGGDCDDHVRALCALAWSLRYPIAVEPIGNPREPSHYTARLGYPAHDSPHGDARTTWLACETTIPALFGEHVTDAARRLP